jgi:hypothetical protein
LRADFFLPAGRAVFFFAVFAGAFFFAPVTRLAAAGFFRAGAAFFFPAVLGFERAPAFARAGFSAGSGASFVITHPLGVAASSGGVPSCWSRLPLSVPVSSISRLLSCGDISAVLPRIPDGILLALSLAVDENPDVNDLLMRCQEHLDDLHKQRRLTSDALPAFRELAEALERRVGTADRRHQPRPERTERRLS